MHNVCDVRDETRNARPRVYLSIAGAIKHSRERSEMTFAPFASFLWWMTVLAAFGDVPILDDILIARSTLTQWQVCFWFARERERENVAVSSAETRAWLYQYFDGWCCQSLLALMRIIWRNAPMARKYRCHERKHFYIIALKIYVLLADLQRKSNSYLYSHRNILPSRFSSDRHIL